MHPDFWQQRWADNQIGFHQSAPTPLLLKHWSSLEVPAGATVFVPLAGKSLDMAWLASQGHRVLGVELSQLAIDQFFAEHGLAPDVEATRYGVHHRAGGIERIRGDAFGLDAGLLAACGAVFDRAALIALPPGLRARYAAELYARLPAGCREGVDILVGARCRHDRTQDSKARPDAARIDAAAVSPGCRCPSA